MSDYLIHDTFSRGLSVERRCAGRHFADLPSLLDDISSFVPWGKEGSDKISA